MKKTSNPHKTLKELIKLSGLTQIEVSSRVGISANMISEYVRGLRMPSFDKAIAMARVLGVPMKTLALSLRLDVSGIPDDIEDLTGTIAIPTVSEIEKP